MCMSIPAFLADSMRFVPLDMPSRDILWPRDFINEWADECQLGLQCKPLSCGRCSIGNIAYILKVLIGRDPADRDIVRVDRYLP